VSFLALVRSDTSLCPTPVQLQIKLDSCSYFVLIRAYKLLFSLPQKKKLLFSSTSVHAHMLKLVKEYKIDHPAMKHGHFENECVSALTRVRHGYFHDTEQHAFYTVNCLLRHGQLWTLCVHT
jgi:hypothetical protein